MFNIIKDRPTHSQKLENWLGKEQLEQISQGMKDWYGPDIAIANVPGNVRARKGGDFVGKINGGGASSLICAVESRTNRLLRRAFNRNRGKLHAGFSSLSDLISEATAGGKKRDFPFSKVGSAGVVGRCNSMWVAAGSPGAGGVSSAAPGGRALNSATTGAFPFSNPGGGDTQHLVGAHTVSSVGPNCLLLYDRLFDVVKTMSSTGTEAVTGVPTRYQSTTPGNMDYAGGNFLFVEVVTTLGAGAHNWTVCQYTDQDGNATQTLPSLTGVATAAAPTFDHAAQWFAPLAAGDTGIKALTQMQCSASITGAINFVMGHPLAFMPVLTANVPVIYDFIYSAFNLTRIFDDAAMALIELMKPATTATTYNGMFSSVAG